MKIEEQTSSYTIALAGQPNTGKSTVFNMLTGAKQHVGNWPGKTVEKKEGIVDYKEHTYHVYDLPGTYSLTANSLEERIARDFIIKEKPDVVVVVVDASQLERSLYMVAETIVLPVPVIIALNMMDVAEQEGRMVDPKALENSTGLKIIPMVASKKQGMNDLLEGIKDVIHKTSNDPSSIPDVEKAFGPLLKEIQTKVSGYVQSPYPENWITLKLLEGDKDVIRITKENMDDHLWNEVDTLLSKNQNGILIGAGARYEWIKQVIEGSVKHFDRKGSLTRQHKFDKVATHPVWGKLIAVGILILGIIAAYIVVIPVLLPGLGIMLVSDRMHDILKGVAPVFIASMIADGFLPVFGLAIVILGAIGGIFLVFGFLEDIGYLARLAYVFDPFMSRLGLHGKSFMPLLMGLVCNIMGVTATRVIDSWRQRLVTLVMAPIIPCKALLIVVSFIGVVFFGTKAIFVYLALFIAMALHLFATSLLLRKFVVKGEHTGLIMELPPYHKPNFKTILGYARVRMKVFLKHGFWLMVAVGFITWVGIYFPRGDIETSFLATFGKAIEPLGRIMGMDWRLLISFLVAFASKEATLCTMAVIFGAATSARTSIEGMMLDRSLWSAVQDNFGSFLAGTDISEASALAFIFAVFFSLPCFGTLGVMYSETQSLKWTGGMLIYYFFASIVMGTISYHVGLLIF